LRFGQVFEGFLPARRLPGDYFELTRLGTALRGRHAGTTFRLGDPIEVRVEKIERAEGKVELSLADLRGSQRGPQPSFTPACNRTRSLSPSGGTATRAALLDLL
jgi:hypothetical protein